MNIFDLVAPFCYTPREALEWLFGTVARLDPPVVVAEIGTHKGGSSIVLAHAILAAGAGQLLCIENWSGMNGKDGPKATPGARNDFYSNFRRLIEPTQPLPWDAGDLPPKGGRYAWQITTALMLSVDEGGSPIHPQSIRDASIDLAYIDGDHTYQAVRRDILSLLPKMRRGRIICGHDLAGESGGVGRAVREMFDEFEQAPGDLWVARV